MIQDLPLSLYIHIPWCVRKCPYCDFNSHESPHIPEQEYVAALVADMQQECEFTNNRPIHSIFFGGGTPSLFDARSIGILIDNAERIFGFENNIEITLEANPGTAEFKNFNALKSVGVNRLSLGVQSFDDLQLQNLGRIHSQEDIHRAFKMAREGGIDNINIDLMHGLPGQTCRAALADLKQAFLLEPEHISWYQLTIEPNTVFYTKPPTLPLDDTLADIQEAGAKQLKLNGYAQYEVSAFARPNRQSAHNLNYWQFGDYVGVGAGAHGKISRDGVIERRWKTRLPNDYLNPEKKFLAGSQTITSEKLALEFMMNALRLTHGVSTKLFKERTGLSSESLKEKILALEDKELLEINDDRLKTTPTGARFLNDVLAAFMTDN